MTSAGCPCGSGSTYAACCAPLHAGQPPQSAEILMRARFSAYTLGLDDFLRNSWHADTRPPTLDLPQASPWRRLVVQSSEEGNDRATVTFDATWQADEQWGVLHETSLFLREDGIWYYHSGDTREQRLKPQRNQPCPCDSGNKFKKCCGH